MKRTGLIALMVACVMPLFGQAPNLFNYQAIAWNAEGDVLADMELTIKFEILRDGEMIWQEDHIVNTNAFGQFSTNIGKEDVAFSGGSVESFAAIDWGLGGYAIRLAVNRGNGFEPLGEPQILASVPYALYAANGPGGTGEVNLALDGTTLSVTDGNQIDLSVLQDGVDDADADPGNELVTQFYLDGNTIILEDAGGLKSVNLDPVATTSPWVENANTASLGNDRAFVGIGTAAPSGKLTIQGNADISDDIPLLEVRNLHDEVVMSTFNNGTFFNIENSQNPRGKGKGVKGGFAIGGYNSAKANGIREYMRVTSDSVRVYFDEGIGSKGRKGGFAIGGYNSAKAEEVEYFSVGLSECRVTGILYVTGGIEEISDMRYKTNVNEIENVLENLDGFRGVYYDWTDEAKDAFNLNDEKQIGVLAQELETAYPELVTTDEDGYKSVEYTKLTAILLQAVKEQQKQIEQLQQENAQLKSLEERISKLEAGLK